jgi:hypothetical protein
MMPEQKTSEQNLISRRKIPNDFDWCFHKNKILLRRIEDLKNYGCDEKRTVAKRFQQNRTPSQKIEHTASKQLALT